ncbi:YybH family protein [Nevskia soli]|uniref:YybH family protein n=1 Tax=Nevskia soli TaxID=418856 RepID=UPI0004A78598|nr:nuclear transport factor 2 family protein [Nevskia soli]
MDKKPSGSEDEAAIRQVVESWTAAVRRRDFEGILRNHASDIAMFDVPPPFQIRGIEAYRKSWDLFFSWSSDPVPFDITEMSITASADVAFVVATMRCAEPGPDGKQKPLDFRLMMGLRKIEGRWIITHEHHSVPAES